MKSAQISYIIDLSAPETHYAKVTLSLKNTSQKQTLFKLPVWTPGSYMVREFNRNIERVSAKNMKVSKTDKNTWKVENNGKDIEFSYYVYCFEQGVRTTYIDQDRTFILGTSLFMFAEGFQNLKGSFELIYNQQKWTNISTTLIQKGKQFEFENYDELVDSPIEIGNHTEFEYVVKNVKHRVAMVGLNNANIEKFKEDMMKITEKTSDIIGTIPCKEYLFIIHHVESGGGGLEHANSNVVQFQRFGYSNQASYTSFLGLLAHEYFHLWNIKRIRPKALGPFNYNQENYTNLLWVAEGITSYYDELLLYRSGFWSQKEYFSALNSGFQAVTNRKGAYRISLHEASFDAWIKEYRPNENSINSQISYYSKGALVSFLLDLKIIEATEGKKNLDDLMKYLYQEFYIKKNIGFTDIEFYESINKVAGKKLDISYFVEQANDENWIKNVGDVIKSFEIQILELEPKKPFTGIITELKGEKLIIKSVIAGSSAENSGLQAGDELISWNNIRFKSNLDEMLFQVALNQDVQILISRSGVIKNIILNIKLEEKSFQLGFPEKPNNIFNKWIAR